MKSVYLYLSVIFFGQASFGQGKDIVLYLDASSSISLTEFNTMRPSIDAIIEGVLNCHENNRLSVVHFATISDNATEANIFIESDFTADPTIALNYARRTNNTVFGTSDHPHESLLVLEDALDGIINPHIHGSTSELNRDMQNELVILMITDASRQMATRFSIHGLLNPYSFAVGSNEAFENYTTFKNERLARFVVVLSPNPNISFSPVIDATRAAASMASAAGGSYNLGFESYPADPQLGESNRYLTVNDPGNFVFSAEKISQVISDVCEACLENLTLTNPDNNVTATSFQRRSISITASNHIDNASTGVAAYHAGNFIELLPGFEAVIESRFVAYIEDCDNDFAYKHEFDDGKKHLKYSKDQKNFKVFPNPSNTSVTVSYNEALKSIRILSMDGKTIFSQKSNENESRIDVSTFVNGIYLISVETQNGQFLQSKFIKN